MNKKSILLVILCMVIGLSFAQIKTAKIDSGAWANNSVNAVIFRKNSLVTYDGSQYAAFYDQSKHLVLAKRRSSSAEWTLHRTSYTGDATDAHRSISIMVDGDGILHIAWGQHNNPLNYTRSNAPGSLELENKRSMTGIKENKVSYPEFYKMPNGDLLFFYRDGGSGNGDLIVDRYSIKSRSWMRLQDNLIDGEGKRSAYWQITTDVKGAIHLSWVWRETPDVASNHDMAYACSFDGGSTWKRSNGETYTLPITAATAEYAAKIPQGSDLINQTSMFADADGHPFIATYWRDSTQKVPQYHIIYNLDGHWKQNSLNIHKQPFSLSGMGTKQVPISRPLIVAWNKEDQVCAALIFRDEERGSKASLAVTEDITHSRWSLMDLSDQFLGDWEPTYDTELWKEKTILDLFIEKVSQVDGEGVGNKAPEDVAVMEWKPGIK